MAIVLLDPELVIARLADQVPPPSLRRVAAAAELAAASEDLKQVPAAYVVPAAERASQNQFATGGVLQRNQVRFAVVLAVSNVSDMRGEKAQADLRILRTSVITALLGWSPDSAFDPVEYVGGRLLRLSDAVLWWQDEFLTAHQLRYV
ncbi:hypothetical protein EBAPG3_010530 [Nitrosospira lacus]|uniref:Uncharacterized protein n=1 Tax=Nitrosospira lacus TaxID=1288494 RepID=A0A1W6SQS0_9PROT|nr:hypothetical protein [Nitrosospira lacus]ARO88178.1 hypothetical protein EBAPG3_010530 [Nitrosospira lacus]